jgi:uncharacterized protein (TIGR03663 family)
VVNHSRFWGVVFIIIMIVGTALRLPRLDLRPMHTDEAVHGIKFESLLEEGEYIYDPYEYHGPTLNYFTLIPAWIAGQSDINQVTEFTLRIVPVFFGLILILLLLYFREDVGWPAVSSMGFLTAISPQMVYYSRYYIMEIMLVLFMMGFILALWKYWKSSRISWAIAIGISAGLMHATKETFIINIGAAALAAGIIFWTKEGRWTAIFQKMQTIPVSHWLMMALSAAVVSVFFFSSFFTNPQGILDSILTYETYLDRAGQQDLHNHPWHYYFNIILFWHYTQGPVWTEAVIFILAIFGGFVVFRKNSEIPGQNLLQFIAVYTIILTIIFSALPYKTPWNMMSFFHGMILLGGVGLVWIYKRVLDNKLMLAAAATVTVGLLHLLWLTNISNFTYYADARNPYVYGHTSNDIYAMDEQIDEIAAVHPRGKDMYVEIIAPGGDYWPFPWYLREYPNVGYWHEVNLDISPAPIIIGKADLEQGILQKIYTVPPPGQRNLYVPLFSDYMELRPHVELRGYVQHALWEETQSRNSEILDSLNVQ